MSKKMVNRRILTCVLALNLIVLGIITLFFLKIKNIGYRSLSTEDGFDKNRIRSQLDSVNKTKPNEDNNEKEKTSDNTRSQGENEKTEKMSYGTDPLPFIPPVPKYSNTDVVPYLFPNVTKAFLELPEIKHSSKIAISTPICNVEQPLGRFSEQLGNLKYPHHLVSVFFGEDSSSDKTLDVATMVANDLKTKYGFNDSEVFHLNISGGVHGSWGVVHDLKNQLKRRSHLAKARNRLLKSVLEFGPFDYVLWIDSDISELPSDLIEQLLFAKSDVVVPSCLYKVDAYKKVFDKNTWRETPTSLAERENLPVGALILEGYRLTGSHRLYLSDLRAEGRIVPLDGVGGCSLLVKATCHRNGLVFPENVYRHHIETEGLALMAKNMGYTVVGMPFVEVFH